MSIDEGIEERALAAIEEVNQLGGIRPSERERIFKKICFAIMHKMNWTELHTQAGNKKDELL